MTVSEAGGPAKEEDQLAYVLQELRASVGKWPVIAAEAGVPYQTLIKVANGKTPDPRYSTVRKLAQWFRNHAGNP